MPLSRRRFLRGISLTGAVVRVGLPPLAWQLREMQEQFRSHGSPDWPVRSGPINSF